MPIRKPIDTAPRDGTEVMVMWTDADGQVNETPARYHSPEKLRATGGDWSDADAGWWVFVDGDTRKKVQPTAWLAPGADE